MKRNIPDMVVIIIVCVGLFIPLIGPIIATIHQIQIHLEMFGVYVGGVHIWNNLDWWYLTLILYAIFGIIIGVKYGEKQDKTTENSRSRISQFLPKKQQFQSIFRE